MGEDIYFHFRQIAPGTDILCLVRGALVYMNVVLAHRRGTARCNNLALRDVAAARENAADQANNAARERVHRMRQPPPAAFHDTAYDGDPFAPRPEGAPHLPADHPFWMLHWVQGCVEPINVMTTSHGAIALDFRGPICAIVDEHGRRVERGAFAPTPGVEHFFYKYSTWYPEWLGKRLLRIITYAGSEAEAVRRVQQGLNRSDAVRALGAQFPTHLLHCVLQRGTKGDVMRRVYPRPGWLADDKVINARGIPRRRFFLFHVEGRRSDRGDRKRPMIAG